jgi:hypothetical protein
MTGRHAAGVAVALTVLLAAVVPARAQTPGACFEVIAAQAGVQPAILVDKCSGRTWQLIKSRRGAYRWTALSRDAGDGAPPVSAAAPSTGGAKCFTFEGRKFCE